MATSVAVVLDGCAWFDAKQRHLIYRPTPGTVADWQPITPHDQAFWLDLAPAPNAEPQRLRALWVPQPDPDAPAVLYLHGTFRNVFQNQPKIKSIHDAGFAVLAIDYRGYGDSSFQLPSEDSVHADTERAWQEFQQRVPNPARRVLYGHSMGSGAATALAWRHRGDGVHPPPYGALVLESAFTSMPDIARDHGIVAGWLAPLSTQHFASIEKIGEIGVPKWFIAGSQDNTVPALHSQRLFDASHEPRTLVLIDGGHHSRLDTDDPQRYASTWAEVARTIDRRAAWPVAPPAEPRR